jgi:hypothetical protein
VTTPFTETAREWDMEMKTQTAKVQAAENDLKQLMADVTQKAEDPFEDTFQAADDKAETGSMPSSRQRVFLLCRRQLMSASPS